jgi:hypothetical protein
MIHLKINDISRSCREIDAMAVISRRKGGKVLCQMKFY